MNDQSRRLRGELKIYLLHQEQPQFSYESADDAPLSLKLPILCFSSGGSSEAENKTIEKREAQ